MEFAEGFEVEEVPCPDKNLGRAEERKPTEFASKILEASDEKQTGETVGIGQSDAKNGAYGKQSLPTQNGRANSAKAFSRDKDIVVPAFKASDSTSVSPAQKSLSIDSNWRSTGREHTQPIDSHVQYNRQSYPIPPSMHPSFAQPSAGFAGSNHFGRIPLVNGSNAQCPASLAASGPAYGSPKIQGHHDILHRPLSPVNPTYQTSQSTSSLRPLKPKGLGGGVIDLTSDPEDVDIEDPDEVTVKSEKMPLARPLGEDGDDDLQVTGEKQSAATAPVCIGQLNGVALILYPIADLTPARDPLSLPGSLPPASPLRVIMIRAAQQFRNGLVNETIKLYSSTTKENFGVLEHRLANVIGPLLTRDNRRGRGMWTEAWVVRTRERSVRELVMLLFTHPQLVPHISVQLERNALYLQHPQTYDPALHSGFRYQNPHGPVVQSAEAERRRREVMNGLGGNYAGRYAAAPKSIEVQREQVEEMFKSMKSGADLGEVEADPLLLTKMYPHQKQALAFLMDRERMRSTENLCHKRIPAGENTQDNDDENMISLWRPRRDVYGRFIGWQNLVTEVEFGSDRPPPQCRGAILADDMGLGKTIVIIALIAASLTDAKIFGSKSPTKDSTSASFDALAAHPAGKSAAQSSFALATADFSTPIYGKAAAFSKSAILDIANNQGKGGKKKKGTKTQKKREDAEAARIERLATRSPGTLIVCPLSTVVNWESQLEEHIGLAGSPASKRSKGDQSRTSTPTDGLSLYIYHGNNRTSDLAELSRYDVVITTFSTLGSEFSKQSRKEQQDEEGSSSSDGGIEEVNSVGDPVKNKDRKRKRQKIQGDALSPLQQIEWFRIVLDEAHMIKEHTTIQARAACDLMAERRICLTGTPLQNSLNDLFSLMRFLRLEPFTDRGIWNTYIGAPAKVGDPLGISRLQLLMRHLALRRTKQSTDKEGKPILSIPPKKDEIRYLQLDEQEKAFYSSHHRRYKHNFEMLEKSDSLLRNYCSILQEVLRLRQICVHMALVRDSEDRAALAKGEDPSDVASAIQAHGLSRGRALRLLALMRDTGAAQCAECGAEMASGGLNDAQDAMEEETSKKKRAKTKKASKGGGGCSGAETDDNVNPSGPRPVITRCQHIFCLTCFQRSVCTSFPDAVSATDRSICSICRDEISPVIDAVQVSASDIDMLNSGNEDEDTISRRGGRKTENRLIEHSTKIRALMQDLFPLSQNNPASSNYAGDAVDLSFIDADEQFQPERLSATKSVVFSQWTKLLDRTEDALQECHIKYTRLDGGMARAERTKALNIFKVDQSCEVLLVSLRAGGVGLNLTHASHVYLMEPSWNPSVENQAIDRIHRLGQTRPVKTVRLIVKDSIEANMLEIQKRKLQLANLSLSQTLSKAQLAERRLEDLRTLFK